VLIVLLRLLPLVLFPLFLSLFQLRRVVSAMLDEDVSPAFLDGASSVDQTQMRRLLSGLTKRQDRAKVAGFIPIDAPSSVPNSNSSDVSIVSSPSARELMPMGCVEERDRFFVVVSLYSEEAQTLRRSVHTSNPLYRRSDDVQFALWALDGYIIETTPFYRPATMPKSARAPLDGQRRRNWICARAQQLSNQSELADGAFHERRALLFG